MTITWNKITNASGTSFTKIPKPSGTTSVITQTYAGGDPIGLLLALTYSSVIGQTSVVTSKWTGVSAPNPLIWYLG